ncbi:MAG: hypothetical protein D6741_03945 [Planctomycetota bacterium]|nr:MAG: hypothetical protein D6741_03945 [Planctomycetota bacterium]
MDGLLSVSRWDVAVTFLFGAQFLGIALACLVRILADDDRFRFLRRSFFGMLGLLGGITVASLGTSPATWAGCGITLAVMVLITTTDFRRSIPKRTA